MIVFTACGGGIARCFDAKSAGLKRVFRGHTGAVNCLKVKLLDYANLAIKMKFHLII